MPTMAEQGDFEQERPIDSNMDGLAGNESDMAGMQGGRGTLVMLDELSHGEGRDPHQDHHVTHTNGN